MKQPTGLERLEVVKQHLVALVAENPAIATELEQLVLAIIRAKTKDAAGSAGSTV